MESIINKIIEIDRLAEERLNLAEVKKKEIFENAKKECFDLEKKLRHDADMRISEIEKINKRDYDALSESLSKKYSDEMNNMDRYYESHHEIIENRIFSEIVGEVS